LERTIRSPVGILGMEEHLGPHPSVSPKPVHWFGSNPCKPSDQPVVNRVSGLGGSRFLDGFKPPKPVFKLASALLQVGMSVVLLCHPLQRHARSSICTGRVAPAYRRWTTPRRKVLKRTKHTRELNERIIKHAWPWTWKECLPTSGNACMAAGGANYAG
jgi:hypothetical protein